ncbi:hypothetical protein [Xylanibacter muris]|uniref:hypothetical protein n=1 Tax=Xylanibacter muris TaxID=2736290 RepID=UPI000FFF6758|nr:hypothetical protein [Xylanibacter muris]RXE69766.1 hypothetical protein ED352_12555 [Muribaculaceae bacterium Isolate-002 (NCI)]
MVSVFLALSAGARKMALDLEWSEFNANIAFIVSFIAMSVIYLVFHDLSVKILQPMFECLFKRLGFKPRTDVVKRDDMIVIDYGTTREQKKRKQEERVIALESKIVKYIGEIMSPYTTEQQLSKLIELSCEFIHTKLAPDFRDSDAVIVSEELSTTDLMHYGWNIAKPFGKPCGHTALFLKQIFPVAFRNTEVYTIEKKLRLNPMQGIIKIDKDIAVNRSEVLTPEHAACKKPSPMKKKVKTGSKSAQEAAIADMLEEGFSGTTDLEDLLLED